MADLSSHALLCLYRSLHLVLPKSNSLFSRVIIESGMHTAPLRIIESLRVFKLVLGCCRFRNCYRSSWKRILFSIHLHLLRVSMSMHCCAAGALAAWTTTNMTHAVSVFNNIANQTGCCLVSSCDASPEVLECLRTVNASALEAAAGGISWGLWRYDVLCHVTLQWYRNSLIPKSESVHALISGLMLPQLR